MPGTRAKGPIVLYSTKSWLAYIIAERYYRSEHHVWCTPYFDPSSVSELDYTVPPSSSPSAIYRTLRDDVRTGDKHSAKIESNKVGIQRGATHMVNRGVIAKEQQEDILSIVEEADANSFRPLILVIPFMLVRNLCKEPPPSQRAHPLSDEFIIERLPRNRFDVINPDGG